MKKVEELKKLGSPVQSNRQCEKEEKMLAQAVGEGGHFLGMFKEIHNWFLTIVLQFKQYVTGHGEISLRQGIIKKLICELFSEFSFELPQKRTL